MLPHRRLADISKHESQYCGYFDVHCIGQSHEHQCRRCVNAAKSLRQSELKKQCRNGDLLLIPFTQQQRMTGCEYLALFPTLGSSSTLQDSRPMKVPSTASS
jgi:hypothetical protein